MNNAAFERHYFCRFTRGYPICPFAPLLSTSSLVSFLPSFHFTVTLLNIRHSAPDLGINLPIALTQYLQNDLLV
ncbi:MULTISPECIES: hypothetical protein, partial [unclassified Aeromonas]|uniref:hypothetical protein n=1 Tax=unclassified Aeromonas TaxID=257493 RepID=UPI0022E25B9B